MALRRVASTFLLTLLHRMVAGLAVEFGKRGGSRMVRFKVAGMSCDHCVQSVKNEIGKVAPGAPISVNLATGEVEVHAAVKPAVAAAAISSAGFQVEQQIE